MKNAESGTHTRSASCTVAVFDASVRRGAGWMGGWVDACHCWSTTHCCLEAAVVDFLTPPTACSPPLAEQASPVHRCIPRHGIQSSLRPPAAAPLPGKPLWALLRFSMTQHNTTPTTSGLVCRCLVRAFASSVNETLSCFCLAVASHPNHKLRLSLQKTAECHPARHRPAHKLP